MKIIFPFFKAFFVLILYFSAAFFWNYHQYLGYKLKNRKLKYLLLGLTISSVFLLVCLSYWISAFIVLLMTIDMFLNLILSTFLSVLMVAKFKPHAFTQNDTRKSLQNLGIQDEAINKIITLSEQTNEIMLAEWGLNNQGWSPFGKIPNLGIFLDSEKDFTPCSDSNENKVQLVIIDKRIAIKKSFPVLKKFLSEAFALVRLQNKINTPDIFKIDLANRIIYRSVIQGHTLKSLLASEKFDISDPERKKVLQEMIKILHQNDLVYGDVRPKNVFLCDNGEICLGDFDLSACYLINHDLSRLARIEDWEFFNQFFNGDVPTPKRLNHLFIACTNDFPEIRNKRRILFPHGKSLGNGSVFDSASWLWSFIAAQLPKNKTRFVHLGVQTGEMAVQSLRAGAQECLILETRSAHQSCAKLLQEAYQILDNSSYSLQFFNCSPLDIANQFWKEGDVICCFGGLDNCKEEEISYALSTIPAFVGGVILEGTAMTYSTILEKNGFNIIPGIKFPLSNRCFLFAYPNNI